VGYVPVDDGLHLALQPKVSLNNLFGMLEYAYNIGEFYDSTVPLESLQALYQRLAVMLARRVLERGRRGYYRAYIPQAERAAVVRGRLDVRRLLAAPWDPQPLCHYDEHTADIEDNRILGWTLYSIARSGLCQGAALAAVKQAYRAVGSLVTPEEIEAARCRGRLYHRLNDDYRPLHALCRFFLENSGPGHRRESMPWYRFWWTWPICSRRSWRPG
jgi:5-methylcytosine-specific restriction enzyme subunit McrC